MTYRARFVVTLIKLCIAAVVAVLLFVIVINAIKNPVQAARDSYTAEFTDVSGMHVNGDVRIKGVLIGKVTSIELVRRDGRSLAEVGFTLEKPYVLTENTALAIRYQNLTGIRYLDFDSPAQPGAPTKHLSAEKTQSSFDITQLFNGLQPVLSTMSTDQINTFTENAISLLEGDGRGLAPMLDSVQTLADYAHDREKVISTLTGNLSRIADTMGGKSSAILDFLRSINMPISAAMTVLDEFPKTARFGPIFMSPVHRLIAALGITEDLDIDKLLADAFSSATSAAEALRLLPVVFAGLQIPNSNARPGAMNCTNGVAQLPIDVTVLLNGSEVVVCNAK
ncbi:MlaD family protein [Nocardia sp. R6R-6]|uniref:MlaD family protein n=1 Tax=Nocardia sp. R6R-6 TaxID=3459303 RepID=UPI00403DB5C6